MNGQTACIMGKLYFFHIENDTIFQEKYEKSILIPKFAVPTL